jgi:DNA (cytosine-5)-methyltransferase 1
MISKRFRKRKLVSLFDGVGCFPLAFANKIGIDKNDLDYLSSEIEPFLIGILEEQFKNVKQLYDIEKVDVKSLNGDIITMGTPCTGFSVSGKRDGLQNVESKLFVNGVEAIKEMKPEYFVWENVFGVYSAGQRSEFREILHYFKETGYDLAWTLLDTKFFGIPQRRRRLFMIGVKSGLPKNNNIFDIKERQSKELLKEEKAFDNHFEFDFNKKSKNPEDHFAFYNRQRSDKFKEIGISNTIAKRDFKGSTDVVIKNGSIRRVVPKERLRLQGIPDDFFDSTYESQKGDKPRFQANGMSVPVVEYVFEQLNKIDGNTHLTEVDYDKEIFISKDIREEYREAPKKTKPDELPKFKQIPYTGQMFFKRDEEGNILDHEEVEFHFAKRCVESSPVMKAVTIDNVLLDEVEEKYHLSEKTLEGFIRRSHTSKLPLPEKMREVMFHKYPNLIEYDKKMEEEYK